MILQAFFHNLPVILSLIIIEGVLSVDNALAIAAMASHLPKKQRKLALQLGILGAYFFRGLALALATIIIDNPWLKICGSVYLIYLASQHFADSKAAESNPPAQPPPPGKLWPIVISIEIMDLSLSIDNVVAAVAMSPKVWVVIAGVFTGILCLRFVAGYCVKLIENFPVFEHTAFFLIGYVGFLLVIEVSFRVEITSLQKCAGIAFIILGSFAFEKFPFIKGILKPVFCLFLIPMGWLAKIVNGTASMLMSSIKILRAE